MNIRIATKNDLEKLNILYKSVIDDMENVKKINIWDEVYPFCEFEKDIMNKEMFVIEDEGKILGSFALSEFDDPEYHTIEWKSNNKKWFYINRLAILPSEQGKGYAKQAMEFINKYAIDNNYDFIRLTVHTDNKYAIGLYEKFGFVKIENGYWSFDDKIFIGFEKEI